MTARRMARKRVTFALLALGFVILLVPGVVASCVASGVFLTGLLTIAAWGPVEGGAK